jgi:hypothetical protein
VLYVRVQLDQQVLQVSLEQLVQLDLLVSQVDRVIKVIIQVLQDQLAQQVLLVRLE